MARFFTLFLFKGMIKLLLMTAMIGLTLPLEGRTHPTNNKTFMDSDVFLKRYFGSQSFTVIPIASANSRISCVTADRKYILRQMPQEVPLEELEICFDVMQQAATLKIAPTVFCASLDERAILIEYLEGGLLTPQEANQHPAIWAEALKKLHGIKPLQLTFYETTFLDHLTWRATFIREKLATGTYSKELTDLLTEDLIQIEKLMQEGVSRLESCGAPKSLIHTDLHGGNLFNGPKIIDWDEVTFSYLSLDLAGFLIFQSIEDEKGFLEAYYGRAPTDQELTELAIAKKTWEAYIALMCYRLLLAHYDHPIIDLEEEIPQVETHPVKSAQFYYSMGRSYLKQSLAAQ